MADPRGCDYETTAGGTFCRYHHGAPSGQCLTAYGEVLVRARQAQAQRDALALEAQAVCDRPARDTLTRLQEILNRQARDG